MKIYFDTEFTGLQKNTTLVSIGLISEDGQTFYAELSDYDRNYAMKNKWFQENVESNLLYKNGLVIDNLADVQVYGTKNDVRKALVKWLNKFTVVELVSDVCHYDMVLFVDIFGTAFDIPKNVCPVCYDINQDIARFNSVTNGYAFDINREALLSDLGVNPIEGKKHNSLYDAKVIKAIYEEIYKIEHSDEDEY